LGGHGGFGGCGGFGAGLGGHGLVGGFGLGGHGLVGCDLVGGFGVGLMIGGTTTGGTVTGGTITGGTTTGGTTAVTGGTTTVTGGTVTGGTVTGGTVTGSGTEIVMVTGFDRVGGLFEPVPGSAEEGVPVGEVPVTDVEAGGVGVTTRVVGVMAVGGAGLADGVGVLVAKCCLGTTINGLPPPAGGVEPKYEPATG
jgi:hypothetical protein